MKVKSFKRLVYSVAVLLIVLFVLLLVFIEGKYVKVAIGIGGAVVVPLWIWLMDEFEEFIID